MATLSLNKASKQVFDYSCTKCEEHDLTTEAQHYCPECEDYLCDKCVKLHNEYHSKHTVFGREDIQMWEGFPIRSCDQHGNKLEVHCNDHQELCCSVCVALNHRQCISISDLPNLAKSFLKTADFKQLSAAMENMRSRLDELKNARRKDHASLKYSYKHIIAEIKAFRKEINTILDQLEKQTVKQLGIIMNDLEKCVKDDIESCANMHDKLKFMMGKYQLISVKHKVTSSYIAYRRCQDQLTKCQSVIHEIEARPKQKLLFNPNTKIETFLKGLDNLGHTDIFQVYNWRSLKHVSVKKDSSELACHIDGIYELPNGDIVIADSSNKRVKLLNSQYQVIAHNDLPDYPQQLCHTIGEEVAVAAGHEVHFIKVSRGGLQEVMKFTIDHDCFSIAHHKGQLYVGSTTALYKHNMDGEVVDKIYEDMSGDFTVYSCAVSPDGERIYVTNNYAHKLLILNISGQVLSTLEDPELRAPTGLCVSPSGHVFVCGLESNTVIQVEREAKQKLATVARGSEGLWRPKSVWFNEQTSFLLVGDIGGISVLKIG